MELNNIIVIVLILLVVGLILGLIGFRYPPKVKIPFRETQDPDNNVTSAAALPDYLNQYLYNNFGDPLPHPSSLTAWGRGRILTAPFPLLGPIWVPLTWSIDLAPGNCFVFQIKLTWFGKVFVKGGDEFKNGHGRFSLGGRAIENANLDLSEATLLWIYSLWLLPFSILGNEHITWSVKDDHTVQAEIIFAGDQAHSFQMLIMPDKHELGSIHTTRTTSREGKELDFHATFNEYRAFDNNYHYPSQISLNWGDEKAYLHLDLTGLRHDVNIEEVIQKGLD
jgi:hypothetical protein